MPRLEPSHPVLENCCGRSLSLSTGGWHQTREHSAPRWTQITVKNSKEAGKFVHIISLKSGHCVCYKSSRVVRLEYEIRLNGRLLNAKPSGPHLYRLQWPFCEPCLPDWHTRPQIVGKKLVGTASAALGRPTSPFAFDRDPNRACFSKSTFTAEFSGLSRP